MIERCDVRAEYRRSDLASVCRARQNFANVVKQGADNGFGVGAGAPGARGGLEGVLVHIHTRPNLAELPLHHFHQAKDIPHNVPVGLVLVESRPLQQPILLGGVNEVGVSRGSLHFGPRRELNDTRLLGRRFLDRQRVAIVIHERALVNRGGLLGLFDLLDYLDRLSRSPARMVGAEEFVEVGEGEGVVGGELLVVPIVHGRGVTTEDQTPRREQRGQLLP
mmetsp:Transcript_5736/g.12504  ORF Transcript_5736/g.12504 Transcript_5736/m.12504 type:complete len:221 (-) Transcript_5736:803-1465(-)